MSNHTENPIVKGPLSDAEGWVGLEPKFENEPGVEPNESKIVLPTLRDGIHTGWVAEHKAFEARYELCTNKAAKFDPIVFKYAPCGARILVCREEAPEMFAGGRLYAPETAKENNPPGAGYVAAVGDMVGAGGAPHPYGLRCEDPSQLLYKRITFGMYSGREFTTRPYADGGFKTVFWVLTDRDIWFIDWGAGEDYET